MSGFEFVFSLYGLLLGLSLVEVLSGLAKAVEARFRPAGERAKSVLLGWLTPLLGVYVMLDLISFWGAAWVARDHLAVSGPVLFGGLVFAGSYYLAAHAVFPGEPAAHVELDSHYFRVRRWVFGVLTTLLSVQLVYWLSVPELAVAFRDPWLLAGTTVSFVLMISAMLVRGRLASILILTLLIGQYLYDYVGEDLLRAAGILS
jgi:hypothetical protein